MKDKNKTKEQLIKELKELRQRVAELDAREDDRMAAQRSNDWEAAEIRMKDSAVESSINGIAFADLMGNIIYVNESFLQMWRCEKEEDVLGEPATSFWHAQVEASEVLERLRNRGTWAGEMVARRRDSSLFTVQVSANMVFDEKGVPICMMGAFVDITERKRMEGELKKHREHLEELIKARTHELEQEVEERKKTEGALRESMETVRALLNAPTESAILLDLEGTILALNTVAAERLGQNVEDLVGVSVYDILPPKLVASRMARANEVVRTGKSVRYKDEREGKIFDQTCYPVFNAQGEVKRLAVFAHDISERKRVESALRESEELFRTIVEVAPSLLIITDEHGRNQYVSPNCKKITGYSYEELVGTLVWWVHKDDALRAKEVFDRALSEGIRGRNFEYKAIRKNGEIWYASSSWEPLRDSKGKFKGVVIQTIDITERKKVEREIENSRRRYRDLFELAPDSIITMDIQGMITSCNAAVGRISGYSREEIVGRHFSEMGMFKAQDIPKYQEFINDILNGDNHYQHIEVNLIRKDGTERIVEAHFGLLKDGDRVTGFQVISHDITERRRTNDEV
ncbi:MAG: PAS domain-containing protein [Gemmatimonadota bacterium]|nr:MAG: PAS domain-containing protein [Gemmatimonadota bacterium]